MTGSEGRNAQRRIFGRRASIKGRKVDPADVPIPARARPRTSWQILCQDQILPLQPGEGYEITIEKGFSFDEYLARVKSAIQRHVSPLSSYRYRCRITARRSILVEVLD